MKKKIVGMARFDGKKLHFDVIGWAMIKRVAKKRKKSPKYIVIEALKRYSKRNPWLKNRRP